MSQHILQGQTASSDSDVLEFETADRAINHVVQIFKDVDEGKKILMILRTAIIKIMRNKLPLKEAEDAMNNLQLNIYVDDRSASFKIGKGGTLLVINIIEGRMDYDWYDCQGKIQELTTEYIEKLKMLFVG